jgi:hypothetical protein
MAPKMLLENLFAARALASWNTHQPGRSKYQRKTENTSNEKESAVILAKCCDKVGLAQYERHRCQLSG